MNNFDTSNDQVILVDTDDTVLGTMDKMAAHQQGHLHRAFSVLLLKVKNNEIFVLLQQRADNKYHCADLWTNSCCSHPRPNEPTIDAARRRLQEEMGIDCPLQLVGQFIYRAELDNGLIEHELDHVFIGHPETNDFEPNPDEVKNTQWISIDTLKKELKEHPEQFTPWFPQVLNFAC